MLLVRDFTLSTNYIRSEATYTYYLRNLALISVSEYLYIDFSPKDYGKLVELKPPSSCSAYPESDQTTIYVAKCESKGNRLLIPFDISVPINTDFVLVINGMTN